MDLHSVEARIKDEYSVVHAFIALHPYTSTWAALFIGLLVGHLL